MTPHEQIHAPPAKIFKEYNQQDRQSHQDNDERVTIHQSHQDNDERVTIHQPHQDNDERVSIHQPHQDNDEKITIQDEGSEPFLKKNEGL